MEITRTHDSLYLSDNRKDSPKEYFKFIGHHILPFMDQFANPKVIDVGCATGEFLWYLSNVYPHAHITGLDIRKDLLERARIEVTKADFILSDITNKDSLPTMKYDALFMLGVNMIFDDHRQWLDNVVTLLSPGGRAFIMGLFNPEDIDVLIKARKANEEGAWEAGWNLISRKTISAYLNRLAIDHSFIEWNINIDLPRHEQDALRSWTFKDENGKRIVVNGTQVIHHFALLEIQAPI